MKKAIFILLELCFIFMIVGCNKPKEKEILNETIKKIDKASSYILKGELEIINNEDSYKYEVESYFKKDNNYKVKLVNKINNHEQIILKNNNGVYVITPSLNKSYKFDTDWPFNNSQIYLLQSLKKDLSNKENRILKTSDDDYIFIVTPNYINNKELVKEEIIINKKFEIKEVRVIDKQEQLKMNMKINKIDYNVSIDDKEFLLESNYETKETMKDLDSIIYPMFLPNNTQLTGQEKINLDDGERFILTFDGENPFTLIQETVKANDELITIPIFGNPEIITDTVGVIDENSLSWISNGVEFYVMSDKLDNNQLLEIAKSINTQTVGK